MVLTFFVPLLVAIPEMEYPKRETEFYIDNIFIENPELPLIREGRLILHLTEKVKKD